MKLPMKWGTDGTGIASILNVVLFMLCSPSRKEEYHWLEVKCLNNAAYHWITSNNSY